MPEAIAAAGLMDGLAFCTLTYRYAALLGSKSLRSQDESLNRIFNMNPVHLSVGISHHKVA